MNRSSDLDNHPEKLVAHHSRHLRILSKIVHAYNTINPFEFATYRKQLFRLVLSLDLALCSSHFKKIKVNAFKDAFDEFCQRLSIGNTINPFEFVT